MARHKKTLTKEEKLAKDRLRKKQRYMEIKQNPQLYAIQKEKERKRYLLRKEKKKILGINEMTPRDQREQRKRWRRNATNYLKRKNENRRIDQILLDNSPPISDTEEQENEAPGPDPLEVVESRKIERISTPSVIRHQTTPPSNALRKIRYRHQQTVKKLKENIEKLKREKTILSRKLSVQMKKTLSVGDSIEKKVNDIIRSDTVEDVKKKLLFAETVKREMKHGYDSLKKMEKINFAKNVMPHKNRMKKYKVLKNMPFRLRSKLPQQTPNKIKHDIVRFFEEDTNSSVAAGKNEFIKRNGIKNQKRYIMDNLKNLHDKFVKEHYYVGYSSFCKYRPFWVVFPSNKRDTCLCKLHCNVDLLMKALKTGKIVKEGSGTEMIKKICCDSLNDKCVMKKCEICRNKVLNYLEFNNEDKITYHQWILEKVKYKDSKGQEKIKTISIKKRFDDNPRNIIFKLHDLQDNYLRHCHNIIKQYSAIKQLKDNFKCDEILIHIDFSENYAFKYNEEIQSFHFGSSRGQASLHTGVIYYLDNQTETLSTKPFCTLSENLNHDAGSIWAHLIPIFKVAQELVPSLKTIHFLSDSPSSQYRNRYIFYMTTKLGEHIESLEKITWNYQEAGHGKGAPDGIGAVVKRTADAFVKFGGDIGSFQEFVKVISQKIDKIHFDIISKEEVSKKRWPDKIPFFRGTMKVHQVVWSLSVPDRVVLRSLSCFTCQDDKPCSHYHLGALHYDVPLADAINDIDSLHIDSPTLANNIENLSAVEDEINLHDLPIPLRVGDEFTEKPKSPAVKILSDVKLDWQNTSFYSKPSSAFNPFDQGDFMKFIQAKSEVSDTVIEPDYYPNIEEDDNSKENYPDRDQPNQESLMEVDVLQTKFGLNNWVIVQYQIKSKIYSYIGKIIKSYNNKHKINFLKKVQGKSLKFFWPDVKDEDSVPENRILKLLADPIINRRGQMEFKNLPKYEYK